MSAVPAGWYPDPRAAGHELWWDGSGWTVNTRLAPSALPSSTATPSPVVVAAVSMPPAGWYLDPENPAEEKWFDGANWTQVDRPREQAPAAPVGLAGVFGQLAGQVEQGARNPQGFYREHRQGLDATAGGALLVDGLVGLPTPGGNRGGLFKALTGVVLGLVFVAVGFVIASMLGTPASMSAAGTGTVTSVHISQGSRSSSGSSSGPTCIPVADFVVGGKTFQASTPMGVGPCPWTVGQRVEVAYDPASPGSAQIPLKGGLTRLMPWMFGGFGALFAVGSLFSLIRSVAEVGAGGFLLARMWRRRKPAAS